tara:strand:+ start:103 stop:849 length:747 start_codon:yes stop_codon:yes gene_type:complete
MMSAGLGQAKPAKPSSMWEDGDVGGSSDDDIDLKIGWKHKEDDEDGSPCTVADLPVEPIASPLLLPGSESAAMPPLQLPPREEPSAYTLKAARMCPRPPVPGGAVLLVIWVLLSAVALMPERRHPPASSPSPSRRCLNPMICWTARSSAKRKAKAVKSQPPSQPALQLACLDPGCWSPWVPFEPSLGLGLAVPIALPTPLPNNPTSSLSPAIDTHCDGWDASRACSSGWPTPFEAHLLNPALMLVLHA